MEAVISPNEQFDQNKRYYNPKYFIFLAPLFSFVLPGILFGINIRNSESKTKGNQFILLTAICGSVLFTGLYFLGAYFQQFVGDSSKYIFEGLNVSIGIYLFQKQKIAYQQWKSYGKKPKYMIFPILIAIIPVAILIVLTVSNHFVNKTLYNYGNNNIYHSDNMDKGDVEKIVNAYIDTGIMKEDNEMVLLIEDHPTEYWFYIPIKNEKVNSESTKKFLTSLENYFNDKKVVSKKMVVIQTNEKFQIIKRK
jgi:hypothetical protein